ncbi:MAG: hypothetical protein PHQ23_04040 [Candidatus Wallbacteria bacterium]|nr:hypothetical protein [Candidatus Wallbacteria bacterium]
MSIEAKYSTLVLRAYLRPYYIFGGLTAIFVITTLPIVLRDVNNLENLIFLAGVLLMHIYVIAGLRAYRLIVTKDDISYTALFKGTKSVRLSDIVNYKVMIGGYEDNDISKPFVRAEINTMDINAKPLCINLKMFDEKELNKVFDILDQAVAENKKSWQEANSSVPRKRKASKKSSGTSFVFNTFFYLVLIFFFIALINSRRHHSASDAKKPISWSRTELLPPSSPDGNNSINSTDEDTQ